VFSGGLFLQSGSFFTGASMRIGAGFTAHITRCVEQVTDAAGSRRRPYGDDVRHREENLDNNRTLVDALRRRGWASTHRGITERAGADLWRDAPSQPRGCSSARG
jgi:hypothetical protein